MSDYIISINGNKREVSFSGNSSVLFEGKKLQYELVRLNSHTYRLRIENKFFNISFDKINSEEFALQIEGKQVTLTVRTALQERASKLIASGAKAQHKIDVKAPMPGMILKLRKQIGDSVQIGDPLVILEAMKMENIIRSPGSGEIKKIFVKEGEPVDKNAVILIIE